MKIERINIANLRNHKFTELEFCDGLNIFFGLNGSGKTTILEAISICAFSKSFQQVKDNSLIQQGKEFYSISVNARNDYGIQYNAVVRNPASGKKEIKSTIGDNLNPKDLIGELPLIILCPDNKMITFGSPSDRREFVDRLLSQSSRIYLDELIKLRKILKQRNNLLNSARIDYHFDRSTIGAWTEMLIQSSSLLTSRRSAFIQEFKPFFLEAYSFITKSKENVDISYSPQGMPWGEIPDYNQKSVEDFYKDFSIRISVEEFKRGITLFGPQRDDIEIKINNGQAKEFASQGQHKSLLIAMKFSEFNFLKSVKNETPVALLDDIFSELDHERALKTLDLLNKNYAQTFITLTDIETILPLLSDSFSYRIFYVSDGVVTDKTVEFVR